MSSKIKDLPVDFVLFTGVAGAIGKDLRQWDIVIAESVIQHDMDARPLLKNLLFLRLNQKIFADKEILEKVYSPKEKLLNNKLKIFGKLSKGLIATGDMFISENKNPTAF